MTGPPVSGRTRSGPPPAALSLPIRNTLGGCEVITTITFRCEHTGSIFEAEAYAEGGLQCVRVCEDGRRVQVRRVPAELLTAILLSRPIAFPHLPARVVADLEGIFDAI